MQKPRVTIIVPVFNEQEAIEKVLSEIRETCPLFEVIMIDDGSMDHTLEKSAVPGTRVIRHPYNIGNGAAVKSGIRAANGDVLVFLDGDGQHDPAHINELLACIDQFDMVVGARKGRHHTSFGRRWMNFIYNKLASYVTHYHVKDLTSGFRAIRTETARELLPLLPNSYSWPTTMTLVLLRSGMSVKYLPIDVHPRQQGRSRIRPVRDSLRFFMIIMKICTLFSPFRIFLPVAAALFGLGLMNYAYTFYSNGRFTNMSAVLFTSAVIVFMMGLVSEQISQISFLRQQVLSSPREPLDGNTSNGQDGVA